MKIPSTALAAALLWLGAATIAHAQSFVEPPARPGTVAYNTWLGRMFSDVLLNTKS